MIHPLSVAIDRVLEAVADEHGWEDPEELLAAALLTSEVRSAILWAVAGLHDAVNGKGGDG